MDKNYYEILEVDVKASKEIIEKAYKVLAKRYHPDTQSEDKKEWAEAEFKKLNEAYEVLSDDDKRKEYDVELDYDKNGVIEALCAKNEHLELLVNKLQQELEYVKTHGNQYINEYTNSSQSNFEYNTVEQSKQTFINEPVYYDDQIIYKRNKLKDLLAFVITILSIIGVGFLLWKIPATNTLLVSLYENNPPIKAIVDLITGIFNR